jgi:processive 1,2-diacylglycerol beta-glucosyltransferase
MINLYNTTTGEKLGSITDEELQFLIDQLEEESLEDQDYAITMMTIEYLAERNAAPDLLDKLNKALGGQREVVVRWERE